MTSDPQTLPDQHERERIVHDLDQTLLVEAAAGTGKTTSLIRRMVALLREGKCTIECLAAVTFTRKAAAEIRSRFQLELERQSKETSGRALARLERAKRYSQRCFVGTIHAFCAQLLRERPVEANLDPSFGELDDSQDSLLRAQAWREYVAHLISTDAPLLPELAKVGLKISAATRRDYGLASDLEEVGLEPIELGPAFMDFAEYADVTDWPTQQSEFPDLKSVRQALLEYVSHMKTIVFPTDIGTDKLMPAYQKAMDRVAYSDLDQPIKLIKILQEMDRNIRPVQKWWPGKKPQAVAEGERWNEFRTRYAQPAIQAFLEHRYDLALRALRPALQWYDRMRRGLNVLHFQDLLIRAARLLREHAEVRRYFRHRFTHLLVDEFQDTDPIQAEVMLLLTADDATESRWQHCRPKPGALFVVGDPKQSIYRFRRADILTYNKVRDIIESVGGAVLPLCANFRSSPEVIDWVNRCFDQKFPAQANDYSPANRPLEAARPSVANRPLSGVLRLVVPNMNVEPAVEAEAALIANTIRAAMDEQWPIDRSADELARGRPPHLTPGDFMVITWKKKRLSLYARTLEQQRIPHQVTGGASLNDVPELALLHQLLRCLTRPDDQIALVAVLRSELFGVPDTWLYQFRKSGGRFTFYGEPSDRLPEPQRTRLTAIFAKLRQFAYWLKRYPAVAAVERICAESGLVARAAAASEGEVQAGSFLKVLELLRQHQDRPTAVDLVELVGRLAERAETHDGATTRPPGDDAVRVMNLHQCKGLEAPIVFLADPSGVKVYDPHFHIDRSGELPQGYLAIRGRKPSEYAPAPLLALPPDWDQHAAEELRFLQAEMNRLLYVAATRAGSALIISQQGKTSRWQDFAEFLNKAPQLNDPGPAKNKTVTTAPFDLNTWAEDVAKIEKRWSAVTAPSHAFGGIKSQAITTTEKPRSAEAQGAEWGSVIHTLLEAAMGSPQEDLQRLAVSALEQEGLSASLLEAVMLTVNAVRKSTVWQRAGAARRCLVEVPIGSHLAADPGNGRLPTSLRGVIDLAFLEPDGWVIVDYKSERVDQQELPALVEHYRPQLEAYARVWQEATGQAVAELGIYFTHSGDYHLTRLN